MTKDQNIPRFTEKITVPQYCVGQLIGRGGENISAIRKESGAHCYIDQKQDEETSTIVTISGSPEAVIKAKGLIFKKIGKIGITNFDVSECNRSTDTAKDAALLAKHYELVRKLKNVQKKSYKIGNSSVDEKLETCSLHHQKMSSFCIQDSVVVCHKCLLYGEHKFHESLDLEIEENRIKMRKIQDEAKQVLLDNVSRSYDSKTDLIKSSFKAWGMKITAHIQILEKLTLTQLGEAFSSEVESIKKSQGNVSNLLPFLNSVDIVEGKVEISESDLNLKISQPLLNFPNYSRSKEKRETSSEQENEPVSFDRRDSKAPPLISLISSSPTDESYADVDNQVIIPEAYEDVPFNDENDQDLVAIDVVFVESPERIHVRKKKYEAAWRRMQKVLNEEGSTADKLKSDPTKGDIILCNIDDNWHRGIIQTAMVSPRQSIQVKLIDSGKTVSLGRSDLFQPSKSSIIKLEKCFVEIVKLVDIEPAGSHQWTQSSVDGLRKKLAKADSDIFMQKLDGNNSVDILIKTKVAEDPFEPGKMNMENLSNYLIRKGLALKMGTRGRCGKNCSITLPTLSPKYDEAEAGPFNSSCVKILDDDVKTEEEVDPVNLSVPDIVPIIPEDQIFPGLVTHIDKNAVVWVVMEDNVGMLTRIREGCEKCSQMEQEVHPGDLVIGQYLSIKVRARVLEICGDIFKCIDVDSGESFQCEKSKIFSISQSLLKIPPLAIPLKLYGVRKTKVEITSKDLVGESTVSSFGRVTVSVMERNIKQLPLPANVWYHDNDDNISGSLSWLLLKSGNVRVCTSYDEWRLEFQDHGLSSWLLDPCEEPHKLSHLPFPLPIAVGVWSRVAIQGLGYPLNDLGEELDVSVKSVDGNLVGCHLLPFSSNMMFDQFQNEVRDSLRMIEKQLDFLEYSFMCLRDRLDKAGETAEVLERILYGQNVLICYNFNEEEREWCRGWVDFIPKEKPNYVWVFLVDYGHRSLIHQSQVRKLDEELSLNPFFCKDLFFKMPLKDVQLKMIRQALRKDQEGGTIFTRVDKIIPRCHPNIDEIQVSFWKAIETGENAGYYTIVQIC